MKTLIAWFKPLRLALYCLFAALVLAGVALWAMQRYWRSIENQQLRLQQTLQQVTAQVHQRQRDLQTIKQHQALFNRLNSERILAPEPQLEWQQAFALYRQQHPQQQLQYQFQSAQPLPGASPMANLQTMATTFSVQLQLRDEVAFSDFTLWLNRRPGVVAPVKCDMRLAQTGAIVLHCDYLWLTIQPQVATS